MIKTIFLIMATCANLCCALVLTFLIYAHGFHRASFYAGVLFVGVMEWFIIQEVEYL